MPDLIKTTTSVFAPNGLLAQKLEGYEPRQGQVDLALAVAHSFTQNKHLIAEAPCGIGKSFAGCVPAGLAAQRTVVVTANIALQEQLVEKDLPFLQNLLPNGFEFALQKGRSNYLCQWAQGKVEEQGASNAFPSEHKKQAKKVLRWASKTETGDRSELDFTPAPAIWSRLSVSGEECLGRVCPAFAPCFANLALAKAAEAKIVVMNYHLFFLYLRRGGLLASKSNPNGFTYIILDEAHAAADIARDCFGDRVSTGTFRHLAGMARKLDVDQALLRDLREGAQAFFQAVGEFSLSAKYKNRLRKPLPLDLNLIERPAERLQEVCTTRAREAGIGREIDDPANSEEARTEKQATLVVAGLTKALRTLRQTAKLTAKGSVCWIDHNPDKPHLTALACKPIKVGPILNRLLWRKAGSVIAMSATLTIEDEFSFARRELGVPEWAAELLVESPFDFERQALAVLPLRTDPLPNDPSYPKMLSERTWRVIKEAEGRTLALFTSYRNLNAVYTAIRSKVTRAGYTLLRQGDAPRTALAARFKEDTRSVLLATASFWAGIDVPGEALSALIIDKIPFPSPAEPLMDYLGMRGSCFKAHMLPRAVITFRQGAGRLIRRCDDRGVLVLLDKRLITKSYGASFLGSLPGMYGTKDPGAIKTFLAGEGGEG